LDPAVEGRRIHAWARSMNWNDALAALRRVFPDRNLPDDIDGGNGIMKYHLEEGGDEFAAELRAKWDIGGEGEDGKSSTWLPLEQAVKETVDFGS
jgi:hypothetical protein